MNSNKYKDIRSWKTSSINEMFGGLDWGYKKVFTQEWSDYLNSVWFKLGSLTGIYLNKPKI